MYIAVNTDFYGFWFAFLFPHPPPLFGLVKDVYKTPLPPRSLPWGPLAWW